MSYRLVTYAAGRGPRAGLWRDGAVTDIADAMGQERFSEMKEILEAWPELEKLLPTLPRSPRDLQAGDFSLLAPVPCPGQIFAAGANYRDHVEEFSAGEDGYTPPADRLGGGRPWFFLKASRSTVTGPDARITLPTHSEKVDWEVELAAVIGRPVRNATLVDALQHVAGYTIANDLSARDHVTRKATEPTSPFFFDWISHKSFDNACPMGPWIVPASEIEDPQALDIKLWLNDELKQSSSTRYMIYNIAEQIVELSSRLTLHPGDVILTGTPGGVGMTEGRFLAPGDRLRLSVQGIGELSHEFV